MHSAGKLSDEIILKSKTCGNTPIVWPRIENKQFDAKRNEKIKTHAGLDRYVYVKVCQYFFIRIRCRTSVCVGVYIAASRPSLVYAEASY